MSPAHRVIFTGFVGGGASSVFAHSDHLGSTSLVTCGTSAGCGAVAYGAVVARRYYYPFGEERPGGTGTLPTTYGFTGQRRDATGLMYYVARYYDPVVGRFISADTIVPEPGNPQALNRYSYSFNNPTNFIDPSGHWPGPFTIGGFIAGLITLGDILANTPPVTGPRGPAPTTTDLTAWLIDAMKTNANAPVTASLRNHWTSGDPIRMAGALKAWVALIGTGAVWDYKVDILEAEARSGIFIPGTTDIVVGGVQIDYDIIANLQFGWLGRAAGFDAEFLLSGAGMAQLVRFAKDTRNPNDFGDCLNSYCDHPFATWSINLGIYLYDLYGDDIDALDEEAFKEALMKYIELYGAPPPPPEGH